MLPRHYLQHILTFNRKAWILVWNEILQQGFRKLTWAWDFTAFHNRKHFLVSSFSHSFKSFNTHLQLETMLNYFFSCSAECLQYLFICLISCEIGINTSRPTAPFRSLLMSAGDYIALITAFFFFIPIQQSIRATSSAALIFFFFPFL